MASDQIKSQKNQERDAYKTVSVITPQHCAFCQSPTIIRWGWRYNHTTKKQRWKCTSCRKLFTAEDGFFKMKHKREVITTCLDLYMNGVSLRKVRDHFNLFSEYKISHQSVLNWIQKYAEMLKDYQQRFSLNLSGVFHADEIFVKCKKEQHYFFDMVDKGTRLLVSTQYSTKRDSQSAKMLFLKAKHKPLHLFTDSMAGYNKAYRKVWGAKTRKQDKQVYVRLKADVDKRNNIIERIQGTIRDRIKVMRSFKEKTSAERILSLFSFYYNFIRVHQGIATTPIRQAGINLNFQTRNKWLELIYHANGAHNL